MLHDLVNSIALPFNKNQDPTPTIPIAGWLAGWLAGWPAAWLAGCWLAGWLSGWLLRLHIVSEGFEVCVSFECFVTFLEVENKIWRRCFVERKVLPGNCDDARRASEDSQFNRLINGLSRVSILL